MFLKAYYIGFYIDYDQIEYYVYLFDLLCYAYLDYFIIIFCLLNGSYIDYVLDYIECVSLGYIFVLLMDLITIDHVCSYIE